MKSLIILSFSLLCLRSFSADVSHEPPLLIGNTTPFYHNSFSSATYGDDGTIYITHLTRDPKTNGSDLFDVISTEVYMLVSNNGGLRFYNTDSKLTDSVGSLELFGDIAADDSHIYSSNFNS